MGARDRADERKVVRGETEPVPYSSAMSCSDPEPTSRLRRIASHRIGVRAAAAFYLTFVICLAVYFLLTRETGTTVAFASLSIVSMLLTALFTRWKIVRHVKECEKARDQGSGSD